MRVHCLLVLGLVIAALPACQPVGTDATPTAGMTTEQVKAAIDKTRNEYVSAWRRERRPTNESLCELCALSAFTRVSVTVEQQ